MTPIRAFWPTLLCALLAACAGAPSRGGPPEEARMAEQLLREGNYEAAAEAFLDAAERSRGQRDHYLLRAAETLRELGQAQRAGALAGEIDGRRLEAVERMRLHLLRAELALGAGDAKTARAELDAIPTAPPAAFRARWLELRGRAFEQEDPFHAARLFAELEPLLPPRERAANVRRIRELLAGLRDGPLLAAANRLAPEDPLRRHLVRALTARGLAVPPVLRPAAEPAAVPSSGRTELALLVPLSGPLGAAGKIVRDGFLAAHFQSDDRQRMHVRVLDSGSTPETALAAYREAVAGGARIVVGPLARDSVAALFSQTRLPVPVVALNRSGPVPPGHVSFALAPEDEGAAVSARMQRRGLMRVVAVVGSEESASRAFEGFRARHLHAGGSVLASIRIDESQIDHLPMIRKGLESAGLPTALPEDPDIEHDPGFDAVFLAARASAARLLVPQIRLFGLSEVPIFAPSMVHVPGGDPRLDRDLAGVEFVDAPWLVDELAGFPSRQDLARLQPTLDGPAARLFAFGMDALALAQVFAAGDFGRPVHGATGVLVIDELGEVQREPATAVFRGGLPQRKEEAALVSERGPQG